MIYFDCEKMRYPNTGLYYYCLFLGEALLRTDIADGLGFFVPKGLEGRFGYDRRYILRNIRAKYFLYDHDIDLWHSTYQMSRYLPHHGRIITTIHDLNYLYEGVGKCRQMRYSRRIGKNIKRSNHIVAISEYVKRDILNHFDTGDTPIDVVYNGCNRYAGTLDEPHPKPTRPFLLAIGTVLPKKNFHVLPCLLKGNGFELVIAGQTSCYADVIMREAREWGVESRVRIVGPVTEGEKHWYLSHCEAFLFPSIAEGFGLPPIEAMQYGKPVFLSDHTCLPEIGGDSAYYFSHDFCRESMRKEFIEGMDNYEANRGIMAERIKAHALSFSWDNTARQYASIYKDMILK